MATALRIGIIGANAPQADGRGTPMSPPFRDWRGFGWSRWRRTAKEPRDEAARAFGVDAAYPSGLDLIRSAEIDLVTVATRVPDHRELVFAALAAGKHVLLRMAVGPRRRRNRSHQRRHPSRGGASRHRPAVARQPCRPAIPRPDPAGRHRTPAQRHDLVGDRGLRAGRAGAFRLSRGSTEFCEPHHDPGSPHDRHGGGDRRRADGAECARDGPVPGHQSRR